MIRHNYDLGLKKKNHNKKSQKKIQKKNFYGQTDGRTTQNYSSEPHKIRPKKKIMPTKKYTP